MSEDQLGQSVRELLQRMQAGRSGDPSPALRDAADRVLAAEAALRAEQARLVSETRELVARNAQLEREVQARDELLSVVGHELRNPISPLFMHVRALLMEARAAEGGNVDAHWLTRRLERFEPHMQRFLAVLDRILDVSRLSSGRIDLQLESLDLTEIVCDIAARYEPEAAAGRCQLRITHPGPVIGTWDALRLEQIASNLVSNAIRYGAGGPVDVRVSAGDTLAIIEVRDHGIGIAPEDQQRIFERFERAPADRRQHGGFGVGLWVVKNLCNALGGEVRVESAPGHGATFTVSLPRGVQAR